MRTILTFGKYKGLSITDPSIPTSYLIWLAGRPRKYRDKHSQEVVWVCPINVWNEARVELVAQGYRLKGSRWEQ